MGSREHNGTKRTQGGTFSDDILCEEHENKTSAADRYAVQFIRELNSLYREPRRAGPLAVRNPSPPSLRRFAITTIWRQIHAQSDPVLSLGPYENIVRDYLFFGGEGPNWPIILNRTQFHADTRDAIDISLYPYRVRFLDRRAFNMVVGGVSFFTITAKEGLPGYLTDWRADRNDPAPVPVTDWKRITDVGSLKEIFARMMRL